MAVHDTWNYTKRERRIVVLELDGNATDAEMYVAGEYARIPVEVVKLAIALDVSKKDGSHGE